jgi:hypothetical protein
MSSSITFEHVFFLPRLGRIQAALTAFFRASGNGPWQPIESQPDDEGTMHFRRGNWETEDSSAGEGSTLMPGFPRWAPQVGYVPSTIPMLLDVSIDVSEETLTLRTRHTAFSRESGAEIRELCDGMVRQEVRTLCKYLKNCFNLPQAPLVTWDDRDPEPLLAG